MNGPTFAGFVAWVYPAMSMTANDLPVDSPFLTYAYNVAVALVNQDLALTPPIYMLAVYNLAASNLLNYAPNNTAGTPPSTYFSTQRGAFGINNFVPGLPNSVSDNGTSVGLTVQTFLQDLTLANLQTLKDPFGRTYLGFAQTTGTLWGLS